MVAIVRTYSVISFKFHSEHFFLIRCLFIFLLFLFCFQLFWSPNLSQQTQKQTDINKMKHEFYNINGRRQQQLNNSRIQRIQFSALIIVICNCVVLLLTEREEKKFIVTMQISFIFYVRAFFYDFSRFHRGKRTHTNTNTQKNKTFFASSFFFPIIYISEFNIQLLTFPRRTISSGMKQRRKIVGSAFSQIYLQKFWKRLHVFSSLLVTIFFSSSVPSFILSFVLSYNVAFFYSVSTNLSINDHRLSRHLVFSGLETGSKAQQHIKYTRILIKIKTPTTVTWPSYKIHWISFMILVSVQALQK